MCECFLKMQCVHELLLSPSHPQAPHLGDTCQCMRPMGEFCVTATVTTKDGNKCVVKLAKAFLSDKPCCGALHSFCLPQQDTDVNLVTYFRTDYMVNRLLLCAANQDSAVRRQLSCKRFEHPGHAHILRYTAWDPELNCIFAEVYDGTLHCVMRQTFFRPTCTETWQNLLRQVLLGLRYIHAVGSVYHRNVHPQVLLFEKTGAPQEWQWRIGDFGSSMVTPHADMEHYFLDVVIMVQWLLHERLFPNTATMTTLPFYTEILLRFAGVPSFRTWGPQRVCTVTHQMRSLVRSLETWALLPVVDTHSVECTENFLLHERRQHNMPHDVAKHMTPMRLC